MKLRVLLIGQNNKTHSQIVYQSSIRLGSSPDCEVVVPPQISSLVSRHHALIDTTDDGVFITDIASTNGTYLNGIRLTERTRLQPTDEIRLGQKGPILRAFETDEQEGESTREDSAQPVPLPLTGASKPSLPPPPPLPSTKAAPAQAPAKSVPAPLPLPRKPLDLDDDSDYRPRTKKKPASNPKTIWLLGGGGVVVAAVIGFLIWRYAIKSKKEEEAPLSSEEIHKRTAASTAFIEVDVTVKGQPGTGRGTGSLIDREQRLVLTAYHVIHDGRNIRVTFPKYKDSKLLTRQQDYSPADSIPATVLKSDPSKDLALLKLDSVPAEAKVIAMGSVSPETGEEVHTVGGRPQASIGLWIYSKGNVREVQEDVMTFDTGQRISAWIIRSTNPINPGDSGGALVNKKCELVGVCSGAKPGVDLVRAFIDIREIKAFVGTTSPTKTETKTTGITFDASKLIGKWIPEPNVTVEFTRDGRLIVLEGSERRDGRYRTDKDKLMITLSVGGMEKSQSLIVKLLTSDRLVTIDEKGKEEEMKRAK